MKKLLSVLLVLALALSLCGTAFAADREGNLELEITAELPDMEIPLLEESMLKVLIDQEGEEPAIQLSVVLPDCDPLSVVLYPNGDELCIAFPGLTDTVYALDAAYLQEFLSQYTDSVPYLSVGVAEGANVQEIKPSPMEILDLMQYVQILSGLMNDNNTTQSQQAYTLAGLGETVDAIVVRITPSLEDWSTVIGELASAAVKDKVIDKYLRIGLEGAYSQNAAYYSYIGQSQDEYVDEVMGQVQQILSYAAENPAELAEELEGFALEIAADDAGIKAIRLDDGQMGVGYESFGELNDLRTDAVVLYDLSVDEALVLVENELMVYDETISGALSSDVIGLLVSYDVTIGEYGPNVDIYCMFSTIDLELSFISEEDATYVYVFFDNGEGVSAALYVVGSDTDETVTIPQGGTVQIADDEAMGNALNDILGSLSNWSGMAVLAA